VLIEVAAMEIRIDVPDELAATLRRTPEELRNAPRTAYVADLVGVNLFAGRLEPLGDGAGHIVTGTGTVVVPWPEGSPTEPIDDVLGVLRPADVTLHTAEPEGSARNVLQGSIAEIALDGERARVRLASAPPVVAEVTRGSVDRLGLREGGTVWASFKAVEIEVMVP